MKPHSQTSDRARRALLGFALMLGSFLSLGGFHCAAQTGTAHEYALKAGVLYHIIEYVEWPRGSNNTSTIEIGLLGDIPFADSLEVLNSKAIQGRKLVVKRIATPAEAESCHVVFVGASEKPRISQIVNELKNRPVLTVGEVEGFAEKGGMVNLIAGPNRIVMEINRQVAADAKLSMSSQLLKLAKLVPQ
jgi:hypothetical protein